MCARRSGINPWIFGSLCGYLFRNHGWKIPQTPIVDSPGWIALYISMGGEVLWTLSSRGYPKNIFSQLVCSSSSNLPTGCVKKNTKRFRTQFSIANGQFMKWPGTLRPNPPKVLWIMSLTWRKYRWVNIADQKSKNSCCSCSYINKHLRWNRKSKTNQGLWTCSTICHSFQFLCSIKNQKNNLSENFPNIWRISHHECFIPL